MTITIKINTENAAYPRRTTVNGGTNGRGEQIDWTPAIRTLFEDLVISQLNDDARDIPITEANYFTPRPYVDQYNTGSNRYGFTWTNARHQVFQATRIATCDDGTYPAAPRSNGNTVGSVTVTGK